MCECQRVYNDDYSKCAHDSVTPDTLCVAWLNNGLARCECQVTVDDLTGMQFSSSLCGPTDIDKTTRPLTPVRQAKISIG